MKTIRPFGTRGLILATALGVSVGVGFASPAFAQAFRSGAVIVNPDGKVTYLGTVGGASSHATGINDFSTEDNCIYRPRQTGTNCQ